MTTETPDLSKAPRDANGDYVNQADNNAAGIALARQQQSILDRLRAGDRSALKDAPISPSDPRAQNAELMGEIQNGPQVDKDALKKFQDQQALKKNLADKGVSDPKKDGTKEDSDYSTLNSYPRLNPNAEDFKKKYDAIGMGDRYQITVTGKDGRQVDTGIWKRKMSDDPAQADKDDEVTARSSLGNIFGGIGNTLAGFGDNVAATYDKATGDDADAKDWAAAGNARTNVAHRQSTVGSFVGAVAPTVAAGIVGGLIGSAAGPGGTIGGGAAGLSAGASMAGMGIMGALQGGSEAASRDINKGESGGQTAGDAVIHGSVEAALNTLVPGLGGKLVTRLAPGLKAGAAKALEDATAKGMGKLGEGILANKTPEELAALQKSVSDKAMEEAPEDLFGKKKEVWLNNRQEELWRQVQQEQGKAAYDGLDKAAKGEIASKIINPIKDDILSKLPNELGGVKGTLADAGLFAGAGAVGREAEHLANNDDEGPSLSSTGIDALTGGLFGGMHNLPKSKRVALLEKINEARAKTEPFETAYGSPKAGPQPVPEWPVQPYDGRANGEYLPGQKLADAYAYPHPDQNQQTVLGGLIGHEPGPDPMEEAHARSAADFLKMSTGDLNDYYTIHKHFLDQVDQVLGAAQRGDHYREYSSGYREKVTAPTWTPDGHLDISSYSGKLDPEVAEFFHKLSARHPSDLATAVKYMREHVDLAKEAIDRRVAPEFQTAIEGKGAVNFEPVSDGAEPHRGSPYEAPDRAGMDLRTNESLGDIADRASAHEQDADAALAHMHDFPSIARDEGGLYRPHPKLAPGTDKFSGMSEDEIRAARESAATDRRAAQSITRSRSEFPDQDFQASLSKSLAENGAETPDQKFQSIANGPAGSKAANAWKQNIIDTDKVRKAIEVWSKHPEYFAGNEGRFSSADVFGDAALQHGSIEARMNGKTLSEMQDLLESEREAGQQIAQSIRDSRFQGDAAAERDAAGREAASKGFSPDTPPDDRPEPDTFWTRFFGREKEDIPTKTLERQSGNDGLNQESRTKIDAEVSRRRETEAEQEIQKARNEATAILNDPKASRVNVANIAGDPQMPERVRKYAMHRAAEMRRDEILALGRSQKRMDLVKMMGNMDEEELKDLMRPDRRLPGDLLTPPEGMSYPDHADAMGTAEAARILVRDNADFLSEKVQKAARVVNCGG